MRPLVPHTRLRQLTGILVFGALLSIGCAQVGRLHNTPVTMSPKHAGEDDRRFARGRDEPFTASMFEDTTIGLVPGTADTAKRFLGRLRQGYTADTLDIMVFGDNRFGYRSTRLATQYYRIAAMFKSPGKFAVGLANIPLLFFRGLWPDLAIIRDVPSRIRHLPTWGPQRTVVSAMVAKIDSIHARGGRVAAIVNTGDLVTDGRYPEQWLRFLKIAKPLYAKVPYFAVAGNHERTDTEDGVANWRTATGLPVASDRLYYCFDSADSWVRFIALDSNPMANPTQLWSREAQLRFSDEQINWMVARLKEHQGPAFVFMHHPPFSAGFHRMEWQADSLLRQEREKMIRAMHDAGLAVLATGHEHAYQRALFTWPDAVMLDIVTGGGGAPLYQLPPNAEAVRLFTQYHVAGSQVKPENVFTGTFNNFLHVRMWPGGGELRAYSVDTGARTTLVDHVKIDLSRYGTPTIAQSKIPVPPKTSPANAANEEAKSKPRPTAADSIAASKRILKPAPKMQKQAARDSVTAHHKFAADSLANKKLPPPHTP